MIEQDLEIYLVRYGEDILFMCSETFRKVFGFSPADNGFFKHDDIAVSVRYFNSLLDTTYQKGGTWDK